MGPTRKRFGQHFLEAPWADRVVAAIQPQASDRFLEIGPGPGALTTRLAPRVAHLTAVEIDRDLASALAGQLPRRASVVTADVLDVDLLQFLEQGPMRVAGNLPYNISSPILFKLIEASRRARAEMRPPLVDATVMLQREVAERVAASPGTGEYGVLSVSVQLYADVQRLLALPPGAFRPPPKVHSAVVRLAFRPPQIEVADERVFEALVRSTFTQRRKTLANSLASFARTMGGSAEDALDSARIERSRRVETLTLAEFARLANHLSREKGGNRSIS